MHKLFIVGVASLLAAMCVTAVAQEAYTTRSVNVRSGPDTSYPAVSALPPGAPVQVMGCLDDWSWCDVAYDNDRGWMYAPYLNYVYQGARVPFYSYAPAFGIPIVTFSVGPYWDRYYRGRPFYGRRDYWYSRPPPVHVRPQGPPPRAAIPDSYRRPDYHGPDRGNAPGHTNNPGYKYNGNNPQHGNNGTPPRGTPPPPQHTPAAQPGRPPGTGAPQQEMRRASPTAPATVAPRGAPQAAPKGQPQPGSPGGTQNHGAPPQGAPQGHPQGNASHGGEHGDNKDKEEPHR